MPRHHPIGYDGHALEPIEVLPECFVNEDDVNRLDYIFDKTAANSRWSNEDVAWAMCRLLHLICGDK